MRAQDHADRIRRLAAVALVSLTAAATGPATSAQAADFALIAPNTMSISGPIELEDCQRWKASMAPGVEYVVLHSNGGRVGEGSCISRSIANLRLKTIVPKKCLSICFLMFAAGVERAACSEARIGVHRPHDVKTHQESTDPKYLNRILDYAQHYGVPPAIQQKIAETPSDSIHDLTVDELQSMHVRPCKRTPRGQSDRDRVSTTVIHAIYTPLPGPIRPIGSPAAPTTVSTGSFVQVTFLDTITTNDIVNFLKAYSVTIVDGPDTKGAFRIRLSDQALPQDRFQAIVDSMRSQNEIVQGIDAHWP